MATRILVIDDEPLICQLLEYQLSGAGYQVSSYQNSAQALLRFAQEQPDLVLLDVMMPGTSGWDVCRQIRAASAVPVIMLTAKQADDDVVMGLNCGADDYIGKPFSEQQLLARIAAVLRRATPAAAPGQRRQQTVRSEPPVARQAAAPASPAYASAAQGPVPPELATSSDRLGPRLTEARNRRNLSLHDAERMCNVRWEFLQAIEQEQFRYVPRDELRNALRAYCRFLDIDLKPYLQRRPPPRRRRAPTHLFGHLAVSAVLVLVIILGIASLLF